MDKDEILNNEFDEVYSCNNISEGVSDVDLVETDKGKFVLKTLPEDSRGLDHFTRDYFGLSSMGDLCPNIYSFNPDEKNCYIITGYIPNITRVSKTENYYENLGRLFGKAYKKSPSRKCSEILSDGSKSPKFVDKNYSDFIKEKMLRHKKWFREGYEKQLHKECCRVMEELEVDYSSEYNMIVNESAWDENILLEEPQKPTRIIDYDKSCIAPSSLQLAIMKNFETNIYAEDDDWESTRNAIERGFLEYAELPNNHKLLEKMGTLLWLVYKISRSEYWFASQSDEYFEWQRDKAKRRAEKIKEELESHIK